MRIQLSEALISLTLLNFVVFSSQSLLTNLQSLLPGIMPTSNTSLGTEVALAHEPPLYYAGVFIGSRLRSEKSNLPYDQIRGQVALLGLYTSTTIFPGNCSEFWDEVDPTDIYSLTNVSTTEETVNYPYFQATGVSATTQIYWTNSSNISVTGIITSNCTTPRHVSFGDRASTLIGLGTEGSNASTYFSIYLNSDPLVNSLLFYFDSTKAQSSTPNIILTSDSNWQVNAVTSIQVGNSTITDLNNTIIFDLNIEPIVLPISIYQAVLGFFGKWLSCGQAFYQSGLDEIFDFTDYPFPTCGYEIEKVEALPDIVLSLGTQNISIPPEVYIQNLDPFEGVVTLNFIAVGAAKGSKFNLTAPYQNYIILGSSFMTYYYTAFQAQNGTNTISLYISNQNIQGAASSNASNDNVTASSSGPVSKSSSGTEVLIILGSLILAVLLVGFGYWCYRKRQQGKDFQEERSLLGEHEVSVNGKQKNKPLASSTYADTYAMVQELDSSL